MKGEVSESFWGAFWIFPKQKQWRAQIVWGRGPGWLSPDFQLMQLFLGWERQYLVTIGYLYRRRTKRTNPNFWRDKWVSPCVIRLSVYGCFRKWWYPQIIHFNRVFHYEPSILGYPYFWKHPYFHVYFRDAVGRNPSPVVLFPIWPASVETAGPFRSDGCESDLPGWGVLVATPFFLLVATWQGGVNSWFLKEQHPSNTSKNSQYEYHSLQSFLGRNSTKWDAFMTFFKWNDPTKTKLLGTNSLEKLVLLIWWPSIWYPSPTIEVETGESWQWPSSCGDGLERCLLFLRKPFLVSMLLIVGGFNPVEKYWPKWESSPSRAEHQKYLKPLCPTLSGPQHASGTSVLPQIFETTTWTISGVIKIRMNSILKKIP